MATCSQIATIMQAYVDGELGPSERVILEQHVGECAGCTAQLREQQRLSATLFEGYRDYRLRRSLRSPVLSHLPEMDHSTVEMEQVNWRAKHRVSFLGRMARLAPAAAVLVLAVLAIVIQMNWPDAGVEGVRVGVVSDMDGAALRYVPGDDQSRSVSVSDVVRAGTEFETGDTARLMVSLANSTQLKLNHDSRVVINDERHLRLTKGEIWLDVGRARRIFKVETQDGVIEVIGTAFTVKQLADRTVVSVERGIVQLVNSHSALSLHRGQQAYMRVAEAPVPMERIRLQNFAEWARALEADRGALAVYETYFANAAPEQPVQGVPVFLLPDNDYASVLVTWKQDNVRAAAYCDYTVYIFTEHGQSVATHRIQGELFAAQTNYEVPIDETAVIESRGLNVRLVPDFSSGSVEAKELNVFGIQRGAIVGGADPN